MTPQGSRDKSGRKKGVELAAGSLLPLVTFVFTSDAEPERRPKVYSDIDEQFYSDFRSSILRVRRELGALQVGGTLTIEVIEARPKGRIPAKLWEEMRPEFEGILHEMLLGHRFSAEIAAGDKEPRCELMLWFGLAHEEEVGQSESKEKPEEQAGFEVVDRGKKIEELLSGLSNNPGQRIQEIGDVYRALRQQVATELAPAVTELLRETGSLNYEQKVALARDINEVLAEAKLAIRDPETGFPAKVEANRPRTTSTTGILRLQDSRPTSSGRRNYVSIEKLDLVSADVELIEGSTMKPGRSR